MSTIRVAVLAVYEDGSHGERQEVVFEVMREVLAGGPFSIVAMEVVPDVPAQIKRVLRLWADRDEVEVILTSGNIRLSTRDHTPDATRELLEKDAPGIAELIRLECSKHSPLAALSRGVAGVRGSTLIVNLPGGPVGVRDSLEVVLPLLPEAVERITGRAVGAGSNPDP